MAPPKPAPEHTIDRTPEYEEFMNKLKAFHDSRGTKLDAEPKVGSSHLDLLKVYQHIVANGGYDKVTEEKLAWRKMASQLGIHSSNEAAVGFSLKSAFYKNLAAYEIKTEFGQEPPPPEILEEVTAKGGSLRTRTLENFRSSDRGTGQNSPQPSGDDGTPARDSTKPEDTPSSGRAARGLRQAPPQRVIFQPDTGPSRPPRQSSAQHSSSPAGNAQHAQQPQSHSAAGVQSNGHSQPQSLARNSVHHMGHAPSGQTPQPHIARGGASASFNPQNFEYHSSTVTSFQPPAMAPLPLRPVETPANAPAKFARTRQPATAPFAPNAPRQAPLPQSLPIQPSPFDGPNIYARCLYALRSDIWSEQAFALHHLLKISYERGDRYKFDGFPGLAEGLTAIAAKAGELFYDVKWNISFDPEAYGEDIQELDGINGTPDILERIQKLTPKPPQDHVQSLEFHNNMVLVSEAALTLRNMLMLPENSLFMAEFPALNDVLCIILNLPPLEAAVELKHVAMDITEQLTPNLFLDVGDPLYLSLLRQLKSVDRGHILTALRALARISMNSRATNNLGGISLDDLELITDWLMLNDDELLDACLDFLYQYTAVVTNVENLLRFSSAKPEKPGSLVKHLTRLLSHGAKSVHRELQLEPERRIPYSEDVAPLPTDLQEQLLTVEEPERCYMWLRSLFEEDPDASITQIAIWTAYQTSFSSRLSQMGKAMISPADFIRNVNHVWTDAGAQIIRGPNGENQKFIIKGIRARSRPVDPDGRQYFRCLWTIPGRGYQKCNIFFANAHKMFGHILTAHLGENHGPDGLYANKEVEHRCCWAGCHKFPTPTKMNLDRLMLHVKTHLVAVEQKFETPQPATTVNGSSSDAVSNGNGGSGASPPSKRQKHSHVVPPKSITVTYEETMTARDERNPNGVVAAGIPLSAVLVLRNIARNVVKTESQDGLLKEQQETEVDEEARGWNEILFRPVLPRLYEIMTENPVMGANISSLLALIHNQ